MIVRSYKELIVWQKSMDLTIMVYKAVKQLPKEEIFSLSDQIRRAAISIPSNIAEGQQRLSGKEFIHFLSIAKGSLAELETQLMICERLNYMTSAQTKPIMDLCIEISKMLNSLLKQLQNRDEKGSA